MSVGHAQIILAWFTIGYTNTLVLCTANVFELCQLYSYELTHWNRTQKYISSSSLKLKPTPKSPALKWPIRISQNISRR